MRGGEHREDRERVESDEASIEVELDTDETLMRFADALKRAGRSPARAHARVRRWSGSTRRPRCSIEPQLTYPTIHVTGTNGKRTTAARVAASVACAHGITVGLYTSPHCLSVTERFSVCRAGHHRKGVRPGVAAPRAVPPNSSMCRGSGGGHVLRGGHRPGVPLVRRQALSGSGCSRSGWAGRGMRRTSWTARSRSSRPIGMDHVAELGPTLEDIAGEKAGILKPGSTAVFREQEPGEPREPCWRGGAAGGRHHAPFAGGRGLGGRGSGLLAVGGQAFTSAGSMRRTRTSTCRCSRRLRRAQRGRGSRRGRGVDRSTAGDDEGHVA